MIRKLFMYIILGIIQGITEPIPVSSSGHLVIFRSLLSNEAINDLNFEIILNFGSFIAIVIFFWNDIKNLIVDFFKYLKTKDKKYYDNFKYCWLIVVGTIPAGLVGILFKDQIESLLSTPKIVGASLIITAGFLYLIRNIKGKKGDKQITFKDALIIGLFQVVALFPGISRSGATLVGAMFLKLKRDTAFKYSFMLYLPISLATMVLGTKDLISSNIESSILVCYFISMIISGIVTYFATKWFNKIVKEGKLIYFFYYCLSVGIIVLLFL